MTSHRQIFKSSAIVGGASAVSIAIGVIKIKVLAVLLGPAGVGLVGIYQNIMNMASTLAGCGMGNSGVRQLAAAEGEEATLALVRRALWLANLVLGVAGMAILWLLRESVALLVFGDLTHVGEIGWLGPGVFLALIAGSQTALLRGLRRIGDLARVNIASALFSAILGISLVYMLGEAGVVWFVLLTPGISAVVASYYAARLPRPRTSGDWRAIRLQWQAMLKLGIPFMAAGLLTLFTQLAARSIILHELGVDASGFFQASWAISVTYIGFVLGAMGADYYPRLTAVISEHSRARELVKEQSEMALLLAGPALLGMITLAPWVIEILYAADFAPATGLLRWQGLGDIFKVASWPMGFILVALGRGGIFIFTEFIWNAAYLGAITLGIGTYGLMVAGVGFCLSYLVYFLVLSGLASRLIGYRPGRENWVFMVFLLVPGGFTIYLFGLSPGWGYAVGLLATLMTGIYSIRRLHGLMNIREWLNRKGSTD
jgi:PST family polysaccharide transporter